MRQLYCLSEQIAEIWEVISDLAHTESNFSSQKYRNSIYARTRTHNQERDANAPHHRSEIVAVLSPVRLSCNGQRQ